MPQTPPTPEELIALAAGRVLARAALDAFARASGGDHARLAYELLDLDEYQMASSDELRVELICEKLRQLLRGGDPAVAWEDVELFLLERVRGVQERLRRANLRRSAQGVAPAPI